MSRMIPTGYRTVDLHADRQAELLDLDTWAFPSSVGADTLAGWPLPLTWERTRGIEADDGELVAMHSSYPFTDVPVPGARTAVSGLTWVGVHPGHRRRGLLRAMVTEHLGRSRARGEALSALFAAEPAIYGRFGYGIAARDLHLTVRRGAQLRDVPGAQSMRVRIEHLDADRHGPLMQQVHGGVDRPGWFTRQTPEQLAAWVHDPEQWRDGAESSRIAVVGEPEHPLGYALFRRKGSWDAEGPTGTVKVREAVATDPAAARALWGVLTDLDLTTTVEVAQLALDDPLWFLLVDPRKASPRTGDNLWLRVLDVPAALAARRYPTEVDLVLRVEDALVQANTGHWRLVGGPDGAQVTAVDGAPDLSLDVRELGSAYLGGVGLGSLAAAGLVAEHTAGAVHRAATAFSWPLAPVCSWVW